MRKTASANTETRPVEVGRAPANSPGKLSWSLPSGESLAEFALRFGFLAPPLLRSKRDRDQGRVRLGEVR